MITAAGDSDQDGRPPGKSRTLVKLATVAIAAAVLGAVYYLFRDELSLAGLAQHEATLRQWLHDYPLAVFAVAFLLYAAVTGLSLPGAAVMSLAYGWFFGFGTGVVLVSFASTTGATLAFLLSRYLFRDAIQQRFGDRLATFNEALRREGAFYLFTLRLIPAVPFFVINVVMGLTNMRVRTFWWVSQLGMLAGTCVYLYAGSTVPSIEQIVDRSQIRTEDIRDWPALMQQLKDVGDGQRETPAGRVSALLRDEARTVVAEYCGEAAPDEQEQITIVLAINDAMKRADFSLSPAWQRVPLEPAKLTRLNRTLLENAFAGVIVSPQPILSWKLLIAFVLLGVFPLLVKKIIGMVRPQPITSV